MRVKATLSLALLLISVCGMAWSQTITGNINGRVADASGAVIVSAKVTATNLSTTVSTSTATNKDGFYSLRFLPIGQYSVSIQAAGFSSETVPGITVEVDQNVEVDVTLKVGGASTSVSVNAGTTPILNTTDGSISTTISQNLVDNLPINGHNFTELAQLVPGSTVADGNQWNGAGQSSPNNSGERVQSFATLPNVNGNRTYTTNFTIDGISIVDTGANLANGFGTPAYNIAPEAVQEVSIITNVPPAEYGDGATQIATVTKSGTDKYHGSASYYLQNYLMDANLYQNKRVIPGTPFSPRTDYTQNIYTGTFGGPVPFLHKDLFFFTDYEAYRKPSAGISATNVPLNAWRGNTTAVTGSPDTSVSPLAGYAYFGSAVPQLYDSQNGFAPFNQTISGVFYQNLVPIRNPVAKYLFSIPGLVPLPNTASSAAPIANDYRGVVKALTRNDQGDIKVDWTPTERDRISGRWSEGDANDGQSVELTPISFPTINDFPFKQLALFYTRTISVSIVNEARIGFTRMHYDSYPLDLSGKFGQGNSLVGIPWANDLPGFSAQNFTESTNSTGVMTFGTAGADNIALDNQFTYGDNLTWQHGRHVSKFGAQIFRIQNNFYQNNSGGLLGGFNYSGAFTGNPAAGQSTGYDFADFLLDYSSGYSVSEQTGDVGLRQYRLGFFAQDDFRFTPNFTINYGVRWEYDQPMYEVNNKLSNINLSTGGLELAGQNGNSNSLYAPTKDDIDPRLGFAWNPDFLSKRLVVRGGFGITTYMDYNLIHNHVGNAPYHIGISTSATTPTSTTSGTPFAVTNGFGTSGAKVTGVSFNVWNTLKPMMEPQYSLVVEYAINGRQSVSVAYVGNVAQHLGDVRNINQEALVATPSSAAFDATTIATSTGNSVTIGTSAVQLYESEAYSDFNAGEATYRLRPTYGLEFQASYTYSHAMGNTSGPIAVNDNNVSGGDPQNSFCLKCEYGPSASDSRHMLNGSWVYKLPVGHGQQFGGNSPTWLNEIIGGWTTSGSAVLFSGQPNTITANGSSGATGAGTLRANHYRHMVTKGGVDGWYETTGGGPYAPNPGLDGRTGAGFSYVIAGEWGTDPSATRSGNVGPGTCGASGTDDGVCAYGQPAVAAAGSAPIFGTASVGSERAQGFRQVDASLEKAWLLHESHELVFDANFYNVGNIVSYNNQGRTTGGGSVWGWVQSTRSEPRQIELELKYKF